MIESQIVKALAQNENLAYPIAAATDEWRIVAAGAGV